MPTHEPWVRYRDSNLFVVPSIHYRQVFAQLVYQACRLRRFDVIALELPRSYQRLGLVDAIAKLGCLPGVVIHTSAPGVLAEPALGDHPDFPESGPGIVRRGVVFPVCPCDSIVMALRCPALLGDFHGAAWSPEIVLVDEERGDRSASGVSLPPLDDYEVMVHGLASFYARMEEWFQLGRNEEDGRRERRMAFELSRYLDRGDRPQVLFVCGAAHWKTIHRLLDEGVTGLDAGEAGSEPGALLPVPIDPAQAWSGGWLDDMPRVVAGFVNACRAGTGADFDKRSATDDLLARASTVARENGVRVSTRALKNMIRLIANRLITRRPWGKPECGESAPIPNPTRALPTPRWLPDLDADWMLAAEACAGKSFAHVLKCVALEYPVPRPPGLEYPSFTFVGKDLIQMKVGDQEFLLKVVRGHAVPRGITLPVSVPRLMGGNEKSEAERSRWEHRRHVPEERALRCRLEVRARYLAHRQQREIVARPFQGDIGLGPAWRATVRARASGTGTLQVRTVKRGREQPCDGSCPIVWVFDANARIDHEWCSFNFHPDRPCEKLYDTFYWCTRRHEFGEANITRRWVAYSVGLATRLLQTCGSVDAIRQRMDRFLEWYPPHRLCTSLPHDDPELSAFEGYEQAIACGVKYAHDHVLVVALPEIPLSGELRSFARARGVDILRVSKDEFDATALARIAIYHSVPRPSPHARPYDWVYRFVPPTDGSMALEAFDPEPALD